MDLLELLEDSPDTNETLPTVDRVLTLNELVADLTKLRGRITAGEELLKELKQQEQVLSGIKIPEMFDELGLKKMSLSDGRAIEIKKSYACSISKDNEEACFDWLVENKHDSIIKSEVAVRVKKGETKELKRIEDLLIEAKIAYEKKNAVHPQTLKAFVKEQIETGDFPRELFNVFEIRETKLK